MVSDEKLAPIQAYSKEGKTDDEVLLTDQHVLQLLLDNKTRNFEELHVEGEYIQTYWSVSESYQQVRWATVTLPADTNDEISSNETNRGMRQIIRKQSRNNESSPSCTPPPNNCPKITTNVRRL